MFETERRMYHALGAKKISTLGITGFTKLSEEIIKTYGEPKLYADEIVKAVTMYKSLAQLIGGLTYFNLPVNYEFTKTMLDTISNLKSSAITPESLRQSLDEHIVDSKIDDTTLFNKLSDVSEIYTLYCENLALEYADKLDDLRIASSLISQHSFFTGKQVFIHGFDSFSEGQIWFLKSIVSHADKSEFIFANDEEASKKPELRAIKTLISRLKVAFSDCGVQTKFHTLDGCSYKPDTELIVANNIQNECEFIAAKIRRFITTERYTCNEIAVLVCNGDLAPRLLESMEEYGISCYADLPEPLITKPLFRFVISTLEALSMTPAKLMSYIRSGFVRVPAELEGYKTPDHNKRRFKLKGFSQGFFEFDESLKIRFITSRMTKRLSKRNMDRLEKAQFCYALKSRDWRSDWANAYRNNRGNTKGDELSWLEPLRTAIVTPLLDLKSACTDTTGDKITEAVCEFLLSTLEIQKTVLALCEKSDDLLKDKKLTEEFRQLWEMMVEVFESLHVSLKNEPMTISAYIDVFKGVCKATNIAKPPQVLDAVVVGDLERTRISDIKIAFIAGANTGMFPKNAYSTVSASVGFSGKEIELLADCGLELTSRLEHRYDYEQLLVHKALTLPSDKLFITAPLSDSSWNELLLSPIFDTLSKKGIPKRKIADGSELPLSFRASTLKAAKRLVAEQSSSEIRDVLITAIAQTSVSNSVDGFIKPYLSESNPAILLPDTSVKLFRFNESRFKFSPSSLEQMMGCRFKYFVSRGLRLEIPSAINEDEPLAFERGNIIHRCLDKILKSGELFNPKYSDDDELSKLVGTYITAYREERIPYNFMQTKRQFYIFDSFTSGIVRMLKQIRKEFANSKFIPSEFEKRVNFSFGKSDFIGTIDRVDRLTTPNSGEYVRVVDYKSGDVKDSRSIFGRMYYGLSMQMLLYLVAENQAKAGVNPVSALYLPSDGNKVKDSVLLPNSPADKLTKNWLKSHIPSGFVVKDNKAFDSVAFDDFKKWESEFKNQSGVIKSPLIELNSDEYERLQSYCEELVAKRVEIVRAGDVKAIPIVTSKSSQREICDYCEFSTVCRKSSEIIINENLMREVVSDEPDS